MNILLLAGGWSVEAEVALSGAKQILASLESRGHKVTLLDPAKDFNSILPQAKLHDLAFINMHGCPGEDGLIQAMLDVAGCPYQGSGPAASFLALHKAASRQIFTAAGLLMPPGIFLPVPPPNLNTDFDVNLTYPLFVKPNTGGSSLDLHKVKTPTQLRQALIQLFDKGLEVIVETMISGQEITCGILHEQALAPILIISKAEYFDYHEKYAANGAKEICPAPISPELTAKVQEVALAAHKALGLKGYSRADFILQNDGTLFLLETNNIPGMTPTSLVPQEAALLGLDFGDLVEVLLGIKPMP